MSRRTITVGASSNVAVECSIAVYSIFLLLYFGDRCGLISVRPAT